MTVCQDFKKFITRGNVIDMAVGIAVGGAFGKIATSLVNDIIMPPIGMMIGGVKFTELAIVLKKATEESAAVSINYGLFIQTIINFVIIAFSIFLVVKIVHGLKKKEEPAPAAPPAPSKEETLLAEIRDLLKEK